MSDALSLVAPGRPFRAGLDRILHAKRGGLVVVGDGPDVLAICSGGFLLDAEFTPQRLSELAKMDGAIVLTLNATRIARANVHLTPKASVQTSETGTRHRTAERVARSLGVGVITVSESMSTIGVYVGDEKRTLEPTSRLVDRATQALSTMKSFRERFDAGLLVLTTAEIEGSVRVDDVTAVLQPAAVLSHIADDSAEGLVELGSEGHLIALQLSELMEGVEEAALAVVSDYVAPSTARASKRAEAVWKEMRGLSPEDVHERSAFAALLDLPGSPDAVLSSRGFRALRGVPRLSAVLVDRLVSSFGSLTALREASTAQLEAVDGVGHARAASIRNELGRLGGPQR
jgi:diadenylate cyclase